MSHLLPAGPLQGDGARTQAGLGHNHAHDSQLRLSRPTRPYTRIPRKSWTPPATYQLTLLELIPPLQGLPFQTPLAGDRLSHDNAGSSNTGALRHGRTKVDQLSPRIHSSVSDPAAPISPPSHLTCHTAEIARNTPVHRLTPLPLRHSRLSCQPHAQVYGGERGGRKRRAVRGGARNGGSAPSSSDRICNTTCPS
jgi:hypothetical protein